MSNSFGHRPYIVSVVINKGGVGKTTTVSNLAAALCARKKKTGKKLKVGIIDLDPQCNVSSVFGADEYIDKYKEETGKDDYPSIAELLLEENWDVHTEHFFTKCDRAFFDDSLSLIMGDDGLGATVSDLEFALRLDCRIPKTKKYEKPKYEIIKRDYFRQLRAKIKNDLKGIYDFILIDTPPSVEFLPQLALGLSDYVVPVITPGTKELRGLQRIEKLIADSYLHHNRDITVAGIILNEMNDQLKLTEEIEDLLKPRYKGLNIILNTKVKPSVRIAEAMSRDLTIFENEHVDAVRHMEIYEEINDELNNRVLGTSKNPAISPEVFIELHYGKEMGRKLIEYTASSHGPLAGKGKEVVNG